MLYYWGMLNKIIVTEDGAENKWFISFNGLVTTNESIEVDEETAQTILRLQREGV